MKLTLKWLEKQDACTEGIELFNTHKEAHDPIVAVKLLVKGNKLDYANWLIVRLMAHEQQIRYAIYAAEQVIGIYEKQYPDDKRPRKAIQAAKDYLKHPDEQHRAAANAAYSAAYSAYTAANAAAYAAYFAVNAAYSAAYSAANAAYSAAYTAAYTAAYAAVNAAANAANAAYTANATYTANAAYTALKKKILRYGLKLLQKEAQK